MLGIASPVFRAMFDSDFKEKDKSEVDLPGKNYNDFVEFLKCIYPDKLNHITGVTVHGILPLASEYQIHTLKDRCEKILVALVKFKHRTDAGYVFRHIYLSELYQLEELKLTCILIASEFTYVDIQNANRNCKISDASLMQVKDFALKRHELNTADDREVLARCSQYKPQSTSCFSSLVLPTDRKCPTDLEQCLKAIISQSAGRSPDKRRILRARRLYERYLPEDRDLITSFNEPITSYHYDAHGGGIPEDLSRMPIDEQMQILPESLKQKLPLDYPIDAVSKALI